MFLIRVLELVDRIILRFIDKHRKRSSRFSDKIFRNFFLFAKIYKIFNYLDT